MSGRFGFRMNCVMGQIAICLIAGPIQDAHRRDRTLCNPTCSRVEISYLPGEDIGDSDLLRQKHGDTPEGVVTHWNRRSVYK